MIIAPDYLEECEFPDSLEVARSCIQKVYSVCNARCYFYGRTELDLNIGSRVLENEFLIFSVFATELEKVCSFEKYAFCNENTRSRRSLNSKLIALNTKISFPWDVNVLTTGNNSFFNQELELFELSQNSRFP